MIEKTYKFLVAITRAYPLPTGIILDHTIPRTMIGEDILVDKGYRDWLAIKAFALRD